ncbi:UDP-N-acetylglucosamine--undecaprenyl-phosphate N-acetylglucosaminephosphotransferase, putative [Syntrophotalea carbinolica DSM 2380]|uniref:UDP-N-acetylglucosamine--undecaprenyl-phosphate N-acetylglucosaminephosphotransferase, putative n=1 Tax=Syntrophotalea carbinolica (strain DSM 2380 / NBRC 103641 / GraBd1) TaxID=338963 RepID=Q3A4H2_SYNC1|nr:MraY family glycosyltransferase [Syntrophotalea carbinolica]ABA88735.1 UDP-N-acetylglucosamine--undecaprenyl-phosphate N-acetylglucosaminephosphotransferase, putative [Syntrophotalea carbinolica DSM 2380]
MVWLHQLYIFMTALFMALIMVPALRRWAIEKRQFDVPNGRKVHVRPKPRLGGVAIFIAFLFAMLVFDDIGRQVKGILAGSLIMFATGLVDDLYGLSAKKKFMGEIFGCLVTIAVGNLYITSLGNIFGTGVIEMPTWLGIPFTVFAIVGVINALNLLDGLDGLAGGFAAVALGTFILLGYLDGNMVVVSLCAALVGGIFGFLRFNVYPARIFMGDAGSLTVGFLLGFLAIFLTQASGSTVQPVIPFIILGLPIIDTVRVMGERLMRRGNPFLPDRTHVHHRFLDLGFHHRFTVLIIHGLTLFWALVAMFCYEQPAHWLLFSYIVLSVLFYSALRLSLQYKDKIPLLNRDSDRSLRESRLFCFLAHWNHKVDPVLAVLLLVFFTWTAFSPIDVGEQVFRTSIVLLLVSSVSFFISRDLRNPFLMALLFMSGMLIAFQSEQLGLSGDGFMLSQSIFSNLLFFVGGLLVVYKVLFRNGERLLYQPSMDFLLFAMALSLAIISPELKLTYRLHEVILKGMVLFISFKILAVHSRLMLRWVFWGIHGLLLTFVLRGM